MATASNVAVVSIPLENGVNLKVDKREAPIGTMRQLQNCNMKVVGELQKRSGWTQLTNQVLGGDRITAGVALAVLNNELFVFDGTTAYSYLPGSSPGWLPKGTFTSVQVADDEVVRNVYVQNAPDCAVLGDLAIYGYLDSRGGARCTVRSVSTGNVLVFDRALDTDVDCVRCVSFGGNLYVVYSQGQDLKAQFIIPSQPNVLQPEVGLVTGALDQTDGFFDLQVSADGTLLYVAYNDLSAGVTFRALNSGLATTASGNVVNARLQAIQLDTGTLLWVAYLASGVPSLLSCAQVNLGGDVIVPFLSVPPDYSVGSVAMAEADPLTHQMVGFWGSSTSIAEQQTWTADFDNSVFPTLSPWMLTVTPLSKCFNVGGQNYVSVQHQSTEQATAFVVTADASQRIVVKDRYTTLGTAAVDGALSNPVLDQYGEWHVAVASGLSPSGVGEFTMNFSGDESFFTAQVDQSAFVVGGGGLQSYDGVGFTEQNFYLFPDVVLGIAGSGGGLSAGTYQYSAVFVHTDNNGLTTRSSVSVPIEVTTTLGGAVEIFVNCLSITDKPADQVVIEVYRSQVNVTGAANLVMTLANDPTQFSVSGVDVLTDLQAASGRILYTDAGAVIDFAPAPPCSLVCTYQDRIFVAGIPGLPNTVAFSNVSDAGATGDALEFNADNTFQVDSLGGPGITALGVINDQLAIFKDEGVFLLNGGGFGPDAGGGGNPYPTPQNVASDAGCTDPNSIVLVGNMSALGLLFKSQKGIYSLQTAQQPNYVGAPVEPYNAQPIASADIVGDQNVVRFVLQQGTSALSSAPSSSTLPNKGTMLQFDYYTSQWMTNTGLDGADSVVYDGVHTLLKSNGKVWQEAPDTYLDPYGFFPMMFETAEVRPFGPQALFKAQRLYIEGQYKGPHMLQVSVAYDNSPFDQQVGQVNATSVFSGSLGTYGYGSGSYGFSTSGSIPGAATYGGLWNSYNLEFYLTRPCHSLRIKVEELQDPAFPIDLGGLIVSNLRLEVVNLNRGPLLPSRQKFS